MPRGKLTPTQVQNFLNGGSGNTFGNPTQKQLPQSQRSISNPGGKGGVNLKPTDPDWKEHFHEIMDMFGNMPVIGSLFNAINAGVYLAEGNVASAMENLGYVVMDLIPGAGELKSAGNIGEDIGKLAEKTGTRLTEGEAEKAGKQIAEKQAEKQAEKRAEKQAGEQAEKDGGKAEKEKQEACRNNKGVGHPVNPITGVKFLDGEEDLDFVLPCAVPLHWQRSYFSNLVGNGWLGQGWSLPFSLCLKRVGYSVLMVDAQGHETRLPMLAPGERKRMDSTGFEVHRETSARYRFTSADCSTQYVFASLTVGEYDGAGQNDGTLPLVAIGDRYGNHQRLLYDEAGMPALIHDAGGRVLRLQFTALPVDEGGTVQRLQRVVLGSQALVSYEYSPEGDLVRVRDADGQATREYRYNNHILIEHSQPGALIARYEYDQYTLDGKVLRLENNLGQTWQFRYLPSRTEVTDALGQTRCYLFNDQKMMVGQIDAAGNATRIDVDGQGNPLRVTDPAGGVRLATYDARGNMTSLTDAAGRRTEIQYHPQWQRPTLIVDAMGAATRVAYDAAGNLIRRTNALGHVTGYAYDDDGRVIRITDAHGKHRHFAYDVHGRLTSHIDCSGRATHYGWDDWGHLALVTNAAGETTRYWRNRRGRLLRTRHADGTGEEFTYDIHGRLIAHTDAHGASTQWERAADGLPVTRIDALGHCLRYEYDAARRLQTLTNENGAPYRFTYDTAGRLVEQQGFDGRLIRYRYDAAGWLTEQIELGAYEDHAAADGNHPDTLRTTYERDKAGRITATTISRAGDERTERITWRYDAAGRLIEASNDCCRLERGYDAVGRLSSETSHVAGRSLTVSYEHDALGNHIRTTLPDGRHIDYLYYGSGHLHQISIDGEVISDIERDALHREVSRTQGELVSHYQYDLQGRHIGQQTMGRAVSGHSAITLISRTYRYDEVGNVREMTDRQSGVHRYRYDPLGQLIESEHETFALDPAHNILDSRDLSPVVGNRVMQFGQHRYVYDMHGNVVEKISGAHTRIRLDYSPAHRIERARVARNGTEEGVEYGYDALGRRVFRKNASGITLFVWEGNRLLSEVRDDRTFVYVYAHNSFVPVAQIESRNAQNGRARDDLPIRYYHTDQIGLPYESTDDAGRTQWRARYAAWGRLLGANGGHEQMHESGRQAHQPLRFQGQYFDEETGLHYNRHRYYDPDAGRFMTQDPIGLRGGINLYRYAPNPGRWIDPLGLAVDLSLVGPHYACNLNNFPNTFQVLGHGSPGGNIADLSGETLTPSELGDYMREASNYRQGQPVTLYACHLGAGGKNSYAQQLSNYLGADVNAPTDVLKTIDLGDGDVMALVANGGGWQKFSPIC